MWWRRYCSKVFANLPEFEPFPEAVEALQSTIGRLGATIRHFGCEDILGICLLHKHFDLAVDERLVRFIDGKDRGHARPVPAEQATDCLPWIWSLNSDPADMRWYCVEWVSADHTPPGSDKVLSHLPAVFDAVAAQIPDGETRLGLAALYAYAGFDIDEGEEVAETSDDARRRLELQVAPFNSRMPGRTVQTLWRFHRTTLVSQI